jgi:tetratricopeptide (TPR) repeat protein
MARDPFEDDLDAGIALEERLDWDAALRHYESLLQRLRSEPAGDAAWQSRLASAEMRRGNALMVLRRMDEARAAFDASLHAAKASADPLVLARALLAAGVFAGSSGDLPRAEPFLLDALERFSRIESDDGRQGAGWTLLNLGGVYGKTGRLDLAFVTLGKARERLFAISNWVGVASAWESQAQLRRAMGDEERWREDLAEAVVFYDRQGMREKSDLLRQMLGGKLV